MFANAYYDFDIGLPYLFPYVGAGIGWQEDAFNGLNAGGYSFNKTRGALAYQGIVGVSFPIASVPGLSATLEYRFVALADSRKFDGSFDGVPASMKVGSEYNNEINVGLRYQLFTPRPVPPAPTPCARPGCCPGAGPGANLPGVLRLESGQPVAARHADHRPGRQRQPHPERHHAGRVRLHRHLRHAQYNMGLSMRRAQAVAAQLVTDGVSQSEIEIHAYGETHLLVPTGPGVREPQNRRVEIVLQ